MSKNTLETLFESRPRLKILKFLFRNFPKTYTLREIINHSQEKSPEVSKELRKLADIGLILRKPPRYGLHKSFEYFTELRDLLLKSPPSEKHDLVVRINKLGKIKVAVIAGVFLDKAINDPLAVDIFLVHDYLDKRKLTQFLKNVEAEIGTEIKLD